MLLRVFLAACVIACSGDDDAEDASRDAADDRSEVGRDTPGDVPSDSADVSEANTDAGPDDPGWQPMPGLPEGCLIEWAEHPERLVTMEWESCGDGCQFLVDDGSYLRSVSPRSLTAPYFELRQWEIVGGDSIAILMALDGAIAAWRTPPVMAGDDRVCQVGAMQVGEGMAAVAFTILIEDTRQERLFHASLDELRGPLEPVAILTPDTPGFSERNTLQNLAVSDTTVAAQVPLNGVWIFQDGRVTRVPAASPQGVTVVGEHVVFSDWGGIPRLEYGTIDSAESSVYRAVEDVHVIGLTNDGTDVTWIQNTYDGGPRPSIQELWSAPYKRDPTDLAPRLVRPWVGGSVVVGGGGHYAYRWDNRSIGVTRLSDGAKFKRELSDVIALVRGIVYVTNTEIAASVKMIGSTRSTLLRVDLDTFSVDTFDG